MRRRPRRRLLSALFTAIGAASCLAPRAAAQEVVEAPQYRSSRPYQSDIDAAQPADPTFKVTGGVHVTDHYFFRGYSVATGFNLQPYFDLHYRVYQDENLAITPHAGMWFNFSEDKGPEVPEHWTEVDVNAGVAVEFRQLTIDFQWQLYTSPNEVFQRSEEVGVKIAYDDTDLWPRGGAIAALNPSVAFFHEYYDQNDNESDAYVGLALEPELQPLDVGKVPLTVSFPLTFGGSYNGYYFNDEGQVDQAGFWSAGIKAAFDLRPLNNVPDCTIEAEVNYIRLLADSVERANGGDSDDLILRVGFVFGL